MKAMMQWVVLLSSLTFLIFSCKNKKEITVQNHQEIIDENISYYSHVAPIIYTHCIQCHSDKANKVAPFSLTTFEDVYKRAEFIKEVIQKRYMPPWPADPSYSYFKNENILTDEEINTIVQWVDEGKIEGEFREIDGKNDNNEEKESPFLTLSMKDTAIIQGDNQDYFKRFTLNGLDEFKNSFKIKKYRFVAGNKKIVHHTELLKAKIEGDKSLEELLYEADNAYIDKKLPFYDFDFVTGWFPGIIDEYFPKGIYAEIEPDNEYFFLIHYAPTPIQEEDFSYLEMYAYENENDAKRKAQSFGVHGHSHVVGEPFLIPKDEKKTILAKKQIQKDISAYSLFVHLHHIAESVLAYAITPENEKIPLIRINQWDFDWQMEYKFEEFVVLPKGTNVYFEVVYNNTSSNPERTMPPRDIPYSFDADDEMMELFLHYVDYEEGDKGKTIDW